MKPFEELTLKDNYMFLRVMSRDDNLQEFLRRLFPERTIKELKIEEERTIQAYYGTHGIRLDIMATEEKDVYNVEMNAGYNISTLRRGRYYTSELDSGLLQQGKAYQELPDVTTVFLIDNDLFRDNICMHKGTVCFTPEGNPPDTDGRTYIYLYISAGHMNVESEIADILRYIKDGTTGNNQYIRKLEEDAEEVRRDPSERRAYMKLSEIKMLERELGREEGREEGRLIAICQVYHNGNIDLKTAAELCDMSEDEFLKAVDNIRKE